MVVMSCSQSSMCPATAPICGTNQMCTACGTPGMSAECATNHSGTPLCGPNGGCVQCLTKDDCDSLQQACDMTTYMCGDCKANTDCTSGLCDTGTGKCVAESTLLYVNNSPTAGCSESGMGTFNRPYCTIQTGFNNAALSNKTLIVFSGTYAESVTAQPSSAAYVVKAIGVGTSPPVIAPPMTPSAPALKLQTSNGQQLTVSLDNFVLQGAVGTNGHGILCSGQGGNNPLTKLTLVRSTVQNNAQFGLSASSCDVTLDQDTFASNAQGGISLASTDHTIMNTLIRDNGTADPSGSSTGGFASSGTFARANIVNDTFVGNKNTTGGVFPSGASCGGTTVFFNDVVAGNSGNAQETGGCAPAYSAYVFIGTAGTNTNITGCSLANLFVNPTNNDYHPNKTAVAPCSVVLVDHGGASSGAVNAPDHDHDGTPRPQPQGGMFDIGCFEVP